MKKHKIKSFYIFALICLFLCSCNLNSEHENKEKNSQAVEDNVEEGSTKQKEETPYFHPYLIKRSIKYL